MPQTDFRPALNGFHFGNHFVNHVLRLPAYGSVTTLGRCGGMSYAALDYYAARLDVPAGADQDFAVTGGVPPDGTTLADYIYRRQLDSFLVPSAVKFITWSLSPDRPSGLLRGVGAWTKDEFARLRAAVDVGRPVPLGLIVASDLTGLGHNHQVVAWGYSLDATGAPASVSVYDNNHPGQDVALTPDPAGTGWLETTGERWRGFFVQDYTPQWPPASSTARAIRSTGSVGVPRPTRRKTFVVTFSAVQLDGDGWLPDGRVALTCTVNGRTTRWPHSGTRRVRAGTSYVVNRTLTVALAPEEPLTVQVNVDRPALTPVPTGGPGYRPVGAPEGALAGDGGSSTHLTLRRALATGGSWRRGVLREGVSGSGSGMGCTIKYAIRPRV